MAHTIETALGIQILEAAGFTVITTERTCVLLIDGVKTRGYSWNSWLSDMDFVVKQIKSFEFERGKKAGIKKMQKDLKILLNIEG